MPEQLSLFEEENTVCNKGMQALLDLRFGAAVDAMRRYRQLFPWGKDVEREIAMAEFWFKRVGRETWNPAEGPDPEDVYGIWLDFEDSFGYPWDKHRVAHKLQRSIFSRLATGRPFERHKDRQTLSKGTPIGLIFLRAGNTHAAVSRLQTLVQVDPEHAKAYGYLGDAHMCLFNLPEALACYQRAFALDPEQVDAGHLLCAELRQRLEDLQTSKGIDGRSTAWLPTFAQLDGLFKPIAIGDMDEAKFWHMRLLYRLKTVDEKADAVRIPLIFHHAMVLSDNATMVQSLPGLDLIETRKTMKQIDNRLFSLHMEQIRERESKGDRHEPSRKNHGRL